MAPARKRNRSGQFTSGGGSVTGGTGDIKPQLLTLVIPAPVGNSDYGVVTVPVPRVILAFTGAATVMEILKVYWYPGISDSADAGAIFGGYLSFRALRAQDDAVSRATIIGDFANSASFAAVSKTVNFVTTGGVNWTLPFEADLTDNNGNGILVATDTIFATSFNVDGTSPSRCALKILYRMVNIDLNEYVGIVQSQAL